MWKKVVLKLQKLQNWVKLTLNLYRIPQTKKKATNPLFLCLGDLNKKTPKRLTAVSQKNTSPENVPCEAMSAKLHGVLRNVTRNQLNEGTNFGRPGCSRWVSNGALRLALKPPKEGGGCWWCFLFFGFQKRSTNTKRGKTFRQSIDLGEVYSSHPSVEIFFWNRSTVGSFGTWLNQAIWRICPSSVGSWNFKGWKMKTSWWFQPNWKILVQMGIFPR